MKNYLISALSVTFLLVFGPNLATADEPIELSMTIEEEVVVIDDQGNRTVKRIPADSIIPGDIVVYTTVYHNKGKQPAESVAITNIIPAELSFIPGSASGSQTITFSVDDQQGFASASELTITESDGKVRPATEKDYTHIRWTIDKLDPDTSGQVSFKAKLK